MLTLILSDRANLAINAGIPVRQEVEPTHKQLENIHGGWDSPRDQTMHAFYKWHL